MSRVDEGAEPPAPTLLEGLLRLMFRIRLFEEALFRAFMSERMPGTMHQAIGQEATEAGVGMALKPEDKVASNHRGHGHAIVRGVSLKALMDEMYGKATGLSRGIGGSMHLYDLQHGFLGTNGIVGAGLPIATGAALASKLEGLAFAVAAFFGDGAMNTGAAHEALNLAAVWKLPLLFVCENNQYAVSMPVTRSAAIPHLSDRAAAYGMPGITVDGNDVLAVYQAALEARARAMSGEGPTLIECVTYRFKGHSRFEPGAYRSKEELESWLARDPITTFCRHLEAKGWIAESRVVSIRQEVAEEVAEAVRFAHEGEELEPGETINWVFAG